MFKNAFLISGLGAIALSGCAIPVVGPTAVEQEQAIFGCAKQVGDQIFPITTEAAFSLAAGAQTTTVRIIPNERVSQRQADSINACAAQQLALSTPDTVVEVAPTSAPAPRATPARVPQTSSCPPGSSVMYRGDRYCVGQ